MKNAEPLLNFAFWLNADSVSAPYCVFEYARPKVAGPATYWPATRTIWIDFALEKPWLITVLNSVSELLDHVRTPFATVVPPFA